MKLEEIEKAFDNAYIGGIDSEIPAHLQRYAMKLVAVAKAAEDHCKFWRMFGDLDIHAAEFFGGPFNPAFKSSDRISLVEALAELEKE